MSYISLRKKKLPSVAEAIAIVLEVGGTFLLATHGKIDGLVISQEGLCWELLSEIALVVYTVQPGRLLDQCG